MPSANLSCREALACKFSGPKSFGLQFRGPKWSLVPRFASSLFVSVRHSVPLGARLSPFAVGGPTTLFDAEERLLKRSVRLLDALELIWTTNGCLRPGVRTVSSTAPGQGKGVGEEPPFPRPVTKGLGQSHIVGGSYVYVAAPIGPGLSEGTNWERRGDKKDLLPEKRLRIRMLPAGSRYIGKRTRQTHQEICQWNAAGPRIRTYLRFPERRVRA